LDAPFELVGLNLKEHNYREFLQSYL